MSISDLKIRIETDPQYFEYKGGVEKSFKDFVISDSIFLFYPHCEFVSTDSGGYFTNIILFMEGIKFKIHIDIDDKTIMNHEFFWDDFDLNDPEISKTVQGDFSWRLTSHNRFVDVPISKSHTKKIDKVVEDLFKDFKFTDKPFLKEKKQTKYKFISPTDNKSQTWYQAFKNNRDFLRVLVTYAHNAKNTNDPFFTFINLQNEIYFSTITDLMSASPINDVVYKVNEDPTAFTDLRNIIDYQLAMMGTDYTMDHYNYTAYNLKPDGTFNQTKDIKIEDYLAKVDKGKKVIRKAYTAAPRDYPYYGIVDIKDAESEKGWINQRRIDAALPYRMPLLIPFNEDAVAGRTIDVEFEHAHKKDKPQPEFTGKWLILESEHTLSENVPMTKVIIGKSGLVLDKGNPFVKDI